MLQVIDLQIGDGRVSCIHLMALGDHLLREILRPVVLVLFHLCEGARRLVSLPLPSPSFRSARRVGDSLVGFLLVSQIAAQKIIFEEEAVFHHLKANVFDDSEHRSAWPLQPSARRVPAPP